MYTIKIENVEKSNGNPYATVSFTRDTGEIEVYKELVTVSPETEDAEAVYDYVETSRPKLEVVYENIYFTTQDELDTSITNKRNELIAKHEAASVVTPGEYTPTETTVVEPTAEEVARNTWLEKWRDYLQAKKGMDALKDAGITPTEEETTLFEGLKKWVADNRKPEYSQFI